MIQANIRIVFKMFVQRVASLVNVICKPIFLQSVKRPWYMYVLGIIVTQYLCYCVVFLCSL